MSRTFPTSGSSTWRPDWLADDAVHGEPVSAPNSLITGKNTGKFANLGRRDVCIAPDVSVYRDLCRVSLRNRTGNFGRENREVITQNREIIRPEWRRYGSLN